MIDRSGKKVGIIGKKGVHSHLEQEMRHLRGSRLESREQVLGASRSLGSTMVSDCRLQIKDLFRRGSVACSEEQTGWLGSGHANLDHTPKSYYRHGFASTSEQRRKVVFVGQSSKEMSRG
jgi:hypothetical protein